MVWIDAGAIVPSDTKNSTTELMADGIYVSAAGTLKVILRGSADADVAAVGEVAVFNYANLVAATHTVALVNTAGTTITATAHASTTTSSDTNTPTFAIGATNLATATNLASCLNANSLLTASVTTDGALHVHSPGEGLNSTSHLAATVTITQVTAGSAGNGAITVTDPGDSGIETTQNLTGGETAITSFTTVNGQVLKIHPKYVLSTSTSGTYLWLRTNIYHQPFPLSPASND